MMCCATARCATAYEHIDGKIGVVGCEESGAGQALFLSRYSDRVTLYPDDPQAMDPADHAKLEANGVSISAMPMARVEPTRVAMEVSAKDGASPTAFDVIYPCFGTRPRTELARQLGLAVDKGGNVFDSGAHFETRVPGFFAARDIVRGLRQNRRRHGPSCHRRHQCSQPVAQAGRRTLGQWNRQCSFRRGLWTIMFFIVSAAGLLLLFLLPGKSGPFITAGSCDATLSAISQRRTARAILSRLRSPCSAC